MAKGKDEAKIAVGEPVGVVAAQSMGEPSTQMVLRSFHSAGMSSVVTTTGLPRIIEIIDARKKLGFPIMHVFMEKGSEKSYEKAKAVKRKIEGVRLGSVLSSFEENLRSATMELAFDREKLQANDLTVKAVLDRIRRGFETVEVSSDGDRATFKYKGKRDIKGVRMTFVRIRGLTVAGLDGISKAVIQQDDNGNFYIMTAGSNVAGVAAVPGVNKERIYSNDIFEIEKVYGIEAARNLIAYELSKTISDEGFTVSFRHVALIADAMTYSGKIRSVGRHGITGDKSSVFARAAYEETVKHFVNASVFGERDILKGVAENILIGKQVNVGTGRIKLTIRKDDLKKIKAASE
jgi:DNA-directed RNA polymerase subunit A"